MTFNVTLETEWRWRGEAFIPVEGIRAVTEEHREGAEEESREEDSSAYPPFPACSPRIPKPLDLGLKLAHLSRGSTLSPALWGCQVQVSEPGPAEGDILPALVGPSPSFSVCSCSVKPCAPRSGLTGRVIRNSHPTSSH